ncbi:MAG: BON domain-containing protein, partial [Myxococcales bacterium]|nr:BON domain-containing protein [Myxococcales bacterium]
MARFVRSAAECAVCCLIMSLAANGMWAADQSSVGNPASEKSGEIEKDDPAVQAEVEKALRHAPGVPDFLIAVQTEGDAVKLYGATETEEQKQAAEKAAKGVDGVSTVENKIVVKDIMSLPDEGPSESVKAQWKARNELRKQLDIPDHLLSVTFKDGTATVTGVAPSEEERAKAER